MNERTPWREADAESYTAWRRIFNAGWTGSDVPDPCPVCGSRTLHQWYMQDDTDAKVLRGVRYKGRGRLWEWCSTCRTFEHYRDGFVPVWWMEPYHVEPGHLRYDPGPIEAARETADG